MRLILALAFSLGLAGCGRPATPSDVGLSLAQVSPRDPAVSIDLVCAGFAPNARIDPRYAIMNRSPPLSWTPAPGAGAYAIILEDPDAPTAAPFVHWLIWNIPGSVISLPEGLPAVAGLAAPPGAVQGRNDTGGFGYYGPHPPSGPAHHYHFQIFALDGPLPLRSDADIHALVSAMQGHVLADGELVGTFQAPGR